MKKILCILTIFLLTSCNCEENEQITEITEINKYYVEHYTYKGHKYLSFGRKCPSMVHDPDCPCHNNY